MRRRVDWLTVLIKLKNPVLKDYFLELIGRSHNGKHISYNRAAYSTLKKYYSTTTIAELCKKVGL